MASKHLAKDGVLSFSMEGFDTYLAEPQRQKLSSLYNTAKTYFENVLLLHGYTDDEDMVKAMCGWI